MTPRCPAKYHQNFDLRGKRLIGFRAILSDYINAPPYRQDRVNIRSLCPIVHEVSCSESVFLENAFSDITA